MTADEFNAIKKKLKNWRWLSEKECQALIDCIELAGLFDPADPISGGS